MFIPNANVYFVCVCFAGKNLVMEIVQNNPDKRKKKPSGKVKIILVMPDKRSFSFITETYKYYCPNMFRDVEQKEKVVIAKPKAKASMPDKKKEGAKGKVIAVSSLRFQQLFLLPRRG